MLVHGNGSVLSIDNLAPQARLPGTAVPSAVQIPFARRRCLWECPFLPAHGPPATNSLAGADFSSILHNCSSDKPAAGLPVPATWPAPDSNARNRTPSQISPAAAVHDQ